MIIRKWAPVIIVLALVGAGVYFLMRPEEMPSPMAVSGHNQAVHDDVISPGDLPPREGPSDIRDDEPPPEVPPFFDPLVDDEEATDPFQESDEEE